MWLSALLGHWAGLGGFHDCGRSCLSQYPACCVAMIVTQCAIQCTTMRCWSTVVLLTACLWHVCVPLQALSKLSQAPEADADGKAEKRSAPDAVAAAAAAGIRKEALACCLQVRHARFATLLSASATSSIHHFVVCVSQVLFRVCCRHLLALNPPAHCCCWPLRARICALSGVEAQQVMLGFFTTHCTYRLSEVTRS